MPAIAVGDIEVVIPPAVVITPVIPPKAEITAALPSTVLVDIVSEDVVQIGVVYSTIPATGTINSGFLAVCGPNPLSGGMLVTTNASGRLVMADPTNPAHNGQSVGMLSSAIMPGDEALVVTVGFLDQPWNFTIGVSLYLGASGQPVPYANLPPGIVFLLNIGSAILPTRVELNVAPIPFTLA